WESGALIVLKEPTITSWLNGVVSAPLPRTSCRPGGSDCMPIATVFGFRITLFVSVRPEESVAVRISSRCEGYSWSGPSKDPLETPTKSWIGWMWQVAGQWCRSSDQVSADAGSGPSLASVAEPEK